MKKFEYQGVSCEFKSMFGVVEFRYDGVLVAKWSVWDYDQRRYQEESTDALLLAKTNAGIEELLRLCREEHLHMERMGQRWQGNGNWIDCLMR